MKDELPVEKKSDNKVIFETVPVEESVADLNIPNVMPEQLTPETVPDDMLTPEFSPQGVEPQTINDSPSSESTSPPMYEHSQTNFNSFLTSKKNQYLVVGLAVVIFVVIFFFLSNIFSGWGKSAEKITLEYWGLWEDPQVIQPLIDDYKRLNPNITINYQKMDHDHYREKLISRSKEGTGPDIFRFHNTWLPSIKEVVSQLPSSVISTSEMENTFYPVVKEDLKIGNYYYGIPLEIDGLILLYNDDLFKKAGITNPPRTWEEIISYSTKLSVKNNSGKIVTSGIAMGSTSNVEHWSDIIGLMMLQSGIGVNNFNSEEGKGIVESYLRFREDTSDNKVWDEYISDNSVTAFIEGKVAMIFAPSWQIIVIKQNNPDINLKTATLPSLPGVSQVGIANYYVEGVSKYSKNQLEAWKFLKFMVQKENQTKMFAEASKIRTFGEPYSRVDLGSTLVQHPYLGALIEQARYMKSIPMVSRTYDYGLNDGIIKYVENAINQRANGSNTSEALKTAQTGIDQILKKFSN